MLLAIAHRPRPSGGRSQLRGLRFRRTSPDVPHDCGRARAREVRLLLQRGDGPARGDRGARDGLRRVGARGRRRLRVAPLAPARRRHRRRTGRARDELLPEAAGNRPLRLREAPRRPRVARAAMGLVLPRHAELAVPAPWLPVRRCRTVRVHEEGRHRPLPGGLRGLLRTADLRGRDRHGATPRRGRSLRARRRRSGPAWPIRSSSPSAAITRRRFLGSPSGCRPRSCRSIPPSTATRSRSRPAT